MENKINTRKILTRKSIMISVVVVLILISGTIGVKHFKDGSKYIKFEVLNEEQIPDKIKEILPRYQALERALACKVNDAVYVVVTRGEKPTGGYTVDIDKIEKIKEEDRFKLVVYAKFTDPKPGDVVTQAVTYPYIVVKTNLTELPYRIELKTRYEDM